MQKSWVSSANDGQTDFPLQNLPFGVFSSGEEGPRIGIAIGDQVLDLGGCVRQGLLDSLEGPLQRACCAPVLNPLMELGRGAVTALRQRVQALLDEEAPSKIRSQVGALLLPMARVTMHLPAAIGDYTDFYASLYHATNVGRLFRPDQPLLPNYKYVPIGYHGRASSIVVSGTPVTWPSGQRKTPAGDVEFGPSQALDYELEIGCFIGPGNALGTPIPISAAGEHVFGVCLLNDWSARDIQSWEYQPLGPFLAKSFCTSISPWIVTMEALAPFRARAFTRAEGDPAPLPYLSDAEDQAFGGLDVTLEVWLQSAQMTKPVRIGRSSSRQLYWTLAQLVTHHTSNGCNLQPGDLLGTGTISGPDPESRGCLLE